MSVHRTTTIESGVKLRDDDDFVNLSVDDYLDACGRRINDTMSATTARELPPNPTGLTLDALVAMTPIVAGQDTIRIASRHLLLSHVKSQDNVQRLFFPDHKVDHKYEENIDHR